MLLSHKQPDGGGFIIGIDATNLRRGGGVTHLVELLRATDPTAYGIRHVVVWGGHNTLAELEDRPWLYKIHLRELDGGLLRRTLWQQFSLSKVARAVGCHLLFVPGGSYGGDFHPVVTMSRNMLPFEMKELLRFGWSLTTTKLLLLRSIQSRSFRRADGVIFLTEYARQGVLRVTGPLSAATAMIPHGLNTRFQRPPRAQFPISQYTHEKPYRVLYVSIINQYKHQWQVVEALGLLRQKTGWPLVLELVGPAYPPALARLRKALDAWDPRGEWVKYHGALPYAELHSIYGQADLGLFASSCENMPNILLETMASGLPIACSNLGPMPEVLGDAGVYFDPEQPEEIASALRELIDSPQLRTELAEASYQRAQRFSWRRCAEETFEFLAAVVRRHSSIDS